jgi:hypothetical protein
MSHARRSACPSPASRPPKPRSARPRRGRRSLRRVGNQRLGKMSGVQGKTNSLLARPPVPIEDGPPSRDSLFQSRPVCPNSATMAKHSKERTQAEAQFKRTQKSQRATESEQAMADYVAAGHAVRAKTASIGQRGGRQEGQDQARHKIEIAPNLILNALSARRSKTKEAGAGPSQARGGTALDTATVPQ